MISRREAIKGLGAAAALPFAIGAAGSSEAIEHPVPSSGERVPVIGMGSSRTFDVGGDPEIRTRLGEVLQIFFDKGGALIDSSPMYGNAESVLGELLAKISNKDRLFAATKVWTYGKESGVEQMQQSMQRMRVPRFDLLQIHNLKDWRVHIETLKEWKAEGKIRYIGITTSHGRDHTGLAKALEAESFDFVQLSYNILDRDVEQHLLPLALDRGVAVLANRPYQRGALFRRVRGLDLPEWASELDCESWGQFFLKFIVSHPAVTCVIPATSKPHHMADNMGAGFGALPDAATRKRMLAHIESL